MRVDRVFAPSLYGKIFARVVLGSCGFPQMKVSDFASILMARASSIVGMMIELIMIMVDSLDKRQCIPCEEHEI